MKYFAIFLLCVTASFSIVSAAETPDYRQMSLDALAKLKTVEAVPFERTNRPEAQWFPKAGFGLFMHWGIHSVKGLEPSWAMRKNCPWQKDYIEYLGWTDYNNPEKYYSLMKEFNPQKYDPDKWIAAAAAADMKYAVITTKHHDGYALWPSEYGDKNTRLYMNGRDLLRPFVDACRKHGLKVGFYFSPPDWGYPGYPVSMDYTKPYTFPEGWTDERNREAFDRFYEYTTGQLSELLTRYGKIDLLWFDGMGWQGITDIRTEKTLAWVRALQPDIVINPRWGGVGDFETPEVNLPEDVPAGWWENCVSWCGHWGYSPHASFLPESWVMTKLVKARSWGGNLLLNVGPDGNGEMRPEYYEKLAVLGAWMQKNGHALMETEGVRNWSDFSNVPVTREDGAMYLFVLPTIESGVTVADIPKPLRVVHLNTGVELTTWRWDENTRTLKTGISMTVRDPLADVIGVYWK